MGANHRTYYSFEGYITFSIYTPAHGHVRSMHNDFAAMILNRGTHHTWFSGAETRDLALTVMKVYKFVNMMNP